MEYLHHIQSTRYIAPSQQRQINLTDEKLSINSTNCPGRICREYHSFDIDINMDFFLFDAIITGILEGTKFCGTDELHGLGIYLQSFLDTYSQIAQVRRQWTITIVKFSAFSQVSRIGTGFQFAGFYFNNLFIISCHP